MNFQHRPIYYPETPISTQHKAAVRDGLTDDNQGDMGNVKMMHFYNVMFGSYLPLATSIIIYFIPCKNMTHFAYAITVKMNDP
jgi:hypothetical protein